MIVETVGASTTKAMQQKIHNLNRFGCSAGEVSTDVAAVLAVGWTVSRLDSGAAIVEREEELRKHARNLRVSAQHDKYTR